MASDPPDVVDAQPLAKVEAQPLAAKGGTHPLGVVMTEAGALLSQGIAKGLDPAALADLIRLCNTQEDRAAAKGFAAAKAAFNGDCPPIDKTCVSNIVSRGGQSRKQTYADLATIARVVDPLLHKWGMSYGWDSTQDKGQLTCICTLRHVNGHSETSSFTCPLETPAAMSPQQKVGSALAYGRRQSLVSVLGLKTADVDDDAVGADGNTEPITEEQCHTLNDLLIQVADLSKHSLDVERGAFLNYVGTLCKGVIMFIAEIPANCFDAALASISQKLRNLEA